MKKYNNKIYLYNTPHCPVLQTQYESLLINGISASKSALIAPASP